MEEKNILISSKDYEKLKEKAEKYANLSGRVEAFADYVNAYGFSVDREICGAILGFEVSKNARE